MSFQVQMRRGTAEEHKTFVGKRGEMTINVDDWTLRVHDGVTPGGASVLKIVVGPHDRAMYAEIEGGEKYLPMVDREVGRRLSGGRGVARFMAPVSFGGEN